MNAIKAIFFALFFAGIFGFAFYSTVPGLMRDWTLRNDYAPLAADVTGQCSTRAMVLNYCDVQITPLSGAAPQEQQMFFVDFDTGALEISAVAAPNDPNVMSTTVGVEKYWNRVATLALLGVIGVLVILASLADLFKKNEPEPA